MAGFFLKFNTCNMENLMFIKDLILIIWLCLWPLACSMSDYYSTKKRILLNKEDYSEDVKTKATLIQIFVWVMVAVLLYTT